ncbi:hypothetical protein FRC01_008679 [Tulasnella sp. 417]|nr:hypothetical protein FRC01_008679 [Tulasnella sp. 417]
MNQVDHSSSQHHTQVCRINDLPYDVFYRLILICWNDAENDFRQKGIHPPTTASHVCRLWRQHAINTPLFWAKLTFQSKIPQLEKYKEWLIRLRGAPFDVRIGGEPFTSASIKHAKVIMQLVMSHISRLRLFQVLYVPKKILRLIFDCLSDANAPLLQTLQVDMSEINNRSFSSPQKQWEPRPFHRGEVPNLQKIQLDTMHYGYSLDRFGETLSTFMITPRMTLVPSHEHIKFVQEVLLQAPNLRVFGYSPTWSRPFDLGFQEMQAFQNPLLLPITHSSLEELYISGKREDVDVILCSLRLPRVRYIADGSGVEPILGLCCLQAIALGTFPSLISLHLGGSIDPFTRRPYTRDPLNSPNLAHLLHALRRLPELRALTFHQVDFEDKQYLLECLGKAGCCPKLGWLNLRQSVGYTMQELREVVEARQQPKGAYPQVQIRTREWPIREDSSQGDVEAREWLGQAGFLREARFEDEQRGHYLRSVEGVSQDVFGWTT